MELILRAYNLKLKHTFTISRESIEEQPSLIVELKSDGFSGFGEATSNPYYKTTVPVMMEDLEKFVLLSKRLQTKPQRSFGQKCIRIYREICSLYVLWIWLTMIYMLVKKAKNYMNCGTILQNEIR